MLSPPPAPSGGDAGHRTRCYAGAGTQRHQATCHIRSDHQEGFFAPFCTGRCHFGQTGQAHRLDPAVNVSFQGKKREQEPILGGGSDARADAAAGDQQSCRCSSASSCKASSHNIQPRMVQKSRPLLNPTCLVPAVRPALGSHRCPGYQPEPRTRQATP